MSNNTSIDAFGIFLSLCVENSSLPSDGRAITTPTQQYEYHIRAILHAFAAADHSLVKKTCLMCPRRRGLGGVPDLSLLTPLNICRYGIDIFLNETTELSSGPGETTPCQARGGS